MRISRTPRTWHRVLAGAAAVLLAVSAAPQVKANVYASALTTDETQIDPGAGQTVMVGYILNENADTNVKIEVLDAAQTVVRTVNLGPQAKGRQTWVWDGKNGSGVAVPNGVYTFAITAADDGYGEWTLLSDSNDLINSFWFPKGPAVNTNLNSPHLGRIYVLEAGTTAAEPHVTAAGRTVSDGIYILNADHTDAIGQGDAAQKGGVAWTTSSSSPYKVVLGPDDRVYVTDWADAHSGVWVGDADFNNVVPVLARDNCAGSGLCSNHGNASAIWIEGLGADRVLYTVDEDFLVDGAAGSVLKYAIGESEGNYAEQPEVFWNNVAAGTRILNFANHLVHDSQGNWWLSQYRAVVGIPSLFLIDPETDTVLWQSMELVGFNDANGVLIDPDPFVGTQEAFAIDERRDRLFGSGGAGVNVELYGWPVYMQWSGIGVDPIDQVAATLNYPPAALGTRFRGMAVDVAGNLYSTTNVDELLYQWSPPDGANSFTTPSWFTVTVGAVGPEIPPELTEIAWISATQVRISWTGDPSKTQILQATDSLTGGVWTEVTRASGATGTYVDTVPAGAARFYQVVQE